MLRADGGRLPLEKVTFPVPYLVRSIVMGGEESHDSPPTSGAVAQQGERRSCKAGVVGSIPTCSTTWDVGSRRSAL